MFLEDGGCIPLPPIKFNNLGLKFVAELYIFREAMQFGNYLIKVRIRTNWKFKPKW